MSYFFVTLKFWGYVGPLAPHNSFLQNSIGVVPVHHRLATFELGGVVPLGALEALRHGAALSAEVAELRASLRPLQAASRRTSERDRERERE